MTDKIIIAVIVVVVLFAHWWIFQWIKFKVDEAVINKLLQSAKSMDEFNVTTVATKTGISEARVAKVCSKSELEALQALVSA